jgi:hypothetical protein
VPTDAQDALLVPLGPNPAAIAWHDADVLQPACIAQTLDPAENFVHQLPTKELINTQPWLRESTT